MTCSRSAIGTVLPLLLLVPFTATVQAQSRILYTASASWQSVHLTPLVRVTVSGDSVTWTGVDNTVRVPGLAAGARYATQLELRPGPAAIVDSVPYEIVGCDERETYEGSGHLSMRVQGQRGGVAGNFPGLTRPGGRLRAPTRSGSVMLRDTVIAALERLGISAAAIDSVQWTQRGVDSAPGGSKILVAAWTLNAPGRWGGEGLGSNLEAAATGVILLERYQDGWHVGYEESSQGTETEMHRRELLGMADLDGDGASEVVISHSYYESWDSQIIARRRGKWVEVWRGGGGGC